MKNYFLYTVCAQYFENKSCSDEILEKGLSKLRNSENDVPEHLHELFSAILILIQMFIRLPKGSLKDNELIEFLKELRFEKLIFFSIFLKIKIKNLQIPK